MAATTLPIVPVVSPALSNIQGPYSVPNWTTLDLTVALAGLTAPLVVVVEHDPDGLGAWQTCGGLDFTATVGVGDFHIVYDQPVPGGAPQLRLRLESSGLFTLASGTLQVA